MRAGFRVVAGLILVVAAVQPLAAQDELIGLDKVHQLFVSKQAHAAARAMSEVSVEFRKQLGRCHDEAIGGRMMETEPKFDALGAKINSGALTSVATLDREFADIDHLLAEHHQQLAADGWSKPRFTKMETVAQDIALSAKYLVRAGSWVKQPLAGDTQKAIDDALVVAKQLAAEPGSPPVNTRAVIDALGQAVKRPIHVAQGGSMP